MLDQLKRMAVLATVVEQGSFVAAAKLLQTTTSAVSQQIRALERDMGVTLLHRTTRKLSLTPAGARFHEGCAAMLSAARGAQERLLQLRDAPEGELRIAAPVGFPRLLGPALAPLLAAHPGLSLHLEVEDGFTDLVAKRIDLAIRFGSLPDSAWIAQRLGEKQRRIYAAPSYLAHHGVPASVAELATHAWLALRPGTDGPYKLTLHNAESERHALSLALRASSNNQLSLQQLCEAGLGLAMLSPGDVADAVQAARLVPLLPGWRLPALPVYAVTPQREAQPAKVRYAIDLLREQLRSAGT